MSAPSIWRDKSHLMRLVKKHCGIYSIKLPLSDQELYEQVIQDDTLPTFSSYFPLVKHVPCDLNQLRVQGDRESTSSDVSDIYEIPPLWPEDSNERFILGIEKITWFNDMRYQQINSTYETIESYQALAVAQSVANLASTMEPPYITEFIPPNRFRISNGTYYKDRVVLHVEHSYSNQLYDIPMGKRGSFYKLALLDMRRFLWENLKYFQSLRTAIAEMNLGIETWQEAESKREEFLKELDGSAHLGRVACVFF